jgi:hypothetical protein
MNHGPAVGKDNDILSFDLESEKVRICFDRG